jgi:hypothetical protein
MAAPIFTDEGGNTLRVTATEVLLRATDDDNASMVHYEIAQQDLTIPADTTRYVGVQYNSGSPNYVVKTADTWNGNTEFRIANVYNEGGTLHIFERLWRAANFQRWVNERWREVEGLKRADATGGLVLGETGVRKVTMTAGVLYEAMEEYSITAIDTSAADTFDIYYDDGASGWTKIAAQTDWPNTLYDDGSGTLQAMTASPTNYYNTHWFYLETDGHLVMVYGTNNDASLSDALGADPPTSLPPRISATGRLLGSITFQKSAITAEAVRSAFFDPFAVMDHGDLSGLGDDDHVKYLHINGRPDLSSTYDWVFNPSDPECDIELKTTGQQAVSTVGPRIKAWAWDTTGFTQLAPRGVLFWNPSRLTSGRWQWGSYIGTTGGLIEDEPTFNYYDLLDASGTTPLAGNWDVGAFDLRLTSQRPRLRLMMRGSLHRRLQVNSD